MKGYLVRKLVPMIALLVLAGAAHAQKKPTLMILPSDNWCTQRFFTTTYENQGETVRIPNYQQAFQEDLELPAVISKIGELMTGLGYSLKDAETELKNLSVRSAENNASFSKTSGASIAENPLDILKSRAKADIIIQIGWVVNNGSLTFTLEAFDAYTSKRIATASGSTEEYDALPTALETSIKKLMKPFDKQLTAYYDNMEKEGREILLTVRRWDSWEQDLESEYEGDELLNHIIAWMQEHTVGQQFNLSDATENFAIFEQVRIPLKDKRGLNMDARAFARELQKFLGKQPFGITSKLMVRGLGESILVLGEK